MEVNRTPVNIEDEMKRSYLDYAMSVIIGRALPDVRDGLKPAHRRVLYAMSQMGLASNRAYRKCAKVIGEVIGNYHPHGDQPAYDTLVRLAQDFNMRKTLVDGQGNFGSVDGDPPAAYRYTEARLEALAESLMEDLDKATVDFVPNFDETTTEPTVFPATYPNLLVNGSTGIAVGMATNIPPHNLGEVIDGVVWLIEHTLMGGADAPTYTREQKLKELIRLIPGPDFPTGGQIVGRRGIHEAFLTGRGSIQVRAKTEIETTKKGDRQQIIVHEIPYQLNKTRLLERIAELVREKAIEGISDLRDESDRDGMRIVIELKRGEVGEVVLNNLYKHTQLQQSFGIITLAIVAGRPKVLSLIEVIELFIDFRREVVRRRIEFELRKAEARAHILDGLRIALDHLDAVIALIRALEDAARSEGRPDHELRPLGDPGAGDPRLAAPAPHRPRARQDPQRAGRADGADREAEEHPRQPAAAAADHRRRAEGDQSEVRGSAPHAADRRGRRTEHRGSDHRRRRRGDGHRYRLHQAHADHDVSHAEPRRQGPHRHADARRGRGQPPVRGVDALLHDDLLGSRPRLLAEGPRDPGCGRGRQGQVDRESRADGIRREAGVDAGRAGVRRPALHHDGHAQGHDQEDRAVVVRQPAGRRHHRHGHRRR